MFAPPLVLLMMLLVQGVVVVWPLWRARPGSLLYGVRGRAMATSVLILLLFLVALGFIDAEAARERAMAQPIGPGWSPDEGVADEARAAAVGLLVTLLGAPYVAVALVLDLLALRKLRRALLAPTGVVDVGLGDGGVERPRPVDYRTDATPDVAVRGDVDAGRRLLVRACIAHGVALAVVGAAFLLALLVSVAAALG